MVWLERNMEKKYKNASIMRINYCNNNKLPIININRQFWEVQELSKTSYSPCSFSYPILLRILVPSLAPVWQLLPENCRALSLVSAAPVCHWSCSLCLWEKGALLSKHPDFSSTTHSAGNTKQWNQLCAQWCLETI